MRLIIFALAGFWMGCTGLVYSQESHSIPFPASLEDAAVEVGRMEDILQYGLILGNGDCTALLVQNGRELELRLTKNDVWDSRLDTSKDPPLPTLKRIKELGKGTWENRKWVLPADWPAEEGVKKRSYDDATPCPRACGVIRVSLGSNQSCSARLDIARAAAVVESEPPILVRALAQRNVFWIEGGGAAKLEAVKSEGLPAAETGQTDGVSWIRQNIPGDIDWAGIEFATAVGEKGTHKAAAIVTSREAKDVVSEAVRLVQETIQNDPAELVRQHEEIWRKFWSVSGIELDDAVLSRTWYRNLYILRCVTKPGVISPGLFVGLINDVPAWHGDYHTNYNIQQTFWSAYNTNHPELAEPYDRLICEYLPRAKWLSKQVFDLEGAYYPHVMYAYEPPDPEQCKSPLGRQYIHHVWGMTIGVAGFTVQPLWWHYKYQPDRNLLEEVVYPPLREVTRFYLNFLDGCERDAAGKVRLGPSVSPEHRGWTEGLKWNYNGTFDIAMVRYILNAMIEAAETLKQDDDLVRRSREALKLLPNYPLAKPSKTEPPIIVDMENAPIPPEYNLAVPATPVFPCDVVSWFSPEKEKELFARSIRDLQWNGNNSTFILGVARARLSMPYASEWIRDEILQRLRPNGTLRLNRDDAPFNEFGHYTEQFGASMAISELLLQSVGDVIRVFPAWPLEKSAKFENLRTQGGFLVSAAMEDGEPGPIRIHSTAGGTLRLHNPWPGKNVAAKSGEQTVICMPDENQIIAMETQAGETWQFQPRAK